MRPVLRSLVRALALLLALASAPAAPLREAAADPQDWSVGASADEALVATETRRLHGGDAPAAAPHARAPAARLPDATRFDGSPPGRQPRPDLLLPHTTGPPPAAPLTQ